jgi:hypothetical protein
MSRFSLQYSNNNVIQNNKPILEQHIIQSSGNRNIISNENTNENTNKNENKNMFKKITINPNLSLDDSQNYKGEINNNTNTNTNNTNTNTIINNNNNIQKSQVDRNRNQVISPKREQTQQIKTISTSTHKNLRQNENLSSTVNDLEMRRKVLQEQQQKELAKLKYKKEQILKIHNRKKEIELMKSIDYEKQKLRIIQNKQNELNNIINHQLIQNGGIQQNGSSISSQTQKHIIYNVDAKKTKKQDCRFLEKQDCSFLEKSRAKKYEETNIDNFKSNKKGGSSREPLVPSLEPLIPSLEPLVPSLEPLVPSLEVARGNLGPLVYYSKKDIPELKWPSKTELYDRSNFNENLTIALGIQPVFGNKKLLKDKNTLEERKTILKNTYNFINISKFNNNTIHSIYKILEYDKIFLIF